MNPSGDRRDFHKWTLAALGGAVAGSQWGCGDSKPTVRPTRPTAGGDASTGLTEMETILLEGPHVCRGLNTCKGLGRSKENECAGQGTCASIADAVCGGHNECKGQGGCGENPGMNACKGKGGCHIPLMADAWVTARGAFEKAMKKQGKEFGAAPEKTPAKAAAPEKPAE